MLWSIVKNTKSLQSTPKSYDRDSYDINKAAKHIAEKSIKNK